MKLSIQIPLARLQTIAQDAPELGPLLALNPSTYPDLLDWLGELQDTQVNAALAKRAELVQRGELENYVTEYMASAKPVSKPPVHPEPQVSQPSKPATDPEPQVSPPSKPATDPQPKTSQPKEPPVSEEPQPSEKPASPVVKNSQPTANELELYQDGSTSAATAAAKMAAINRARTAAPRDYLASYPAAPALSTTEKIGARLSSPARTARHRFNRFWFWIIVGLLIWLVVIVLAVWGLTSQAEKPVSLNANAAEPTPSVSATPQELVQTSLPEGYTGPTKIIEVPGPHPGQTIKQVVPDDSASASASPTPTPTPTNPLAPPQMPRNSTVLPLQMAMFAAFSAGHKYSVSLTPRILTIVLRKPRIRDTAMRFTPRTAATTSMRVSNLSTPLRKGLWLPTKR